MMPQDKKQDVTFNMVDEIHNAVRLRSDSDQYWIRK